MILLLLSARGRGAMCSHPFVVDVVERFTMVKGILDSESFEIAFLDLDKLVLLTFTDFATDLANTDFCNKNPNYIIHTYITYIYIIGL